MSVPTRHHLEQPVVGPAEPAELAVLRYPRHVGEHELSYSSRRPPARTISAGANVVKVRSTKQLSDCPFPVPVQPDCHRRRQPNPT